MTDQELQGIAAQALNIAKRDIEQKKNFNFLLGAVHKGESLHRMEKVEALIVEKLGEQWLDSGAAKDVGFKIMRVAVNLLPPEAVVFVVSINEFEPTEKLEALSPEKRKKLLEDSGHEQHHRMVRQGYLKMHDAFSCIAQTSERVCSYILRTGEEKARTKFFDQKDFDGRLKMFGGKPEWQI